MAKYGMPYKGSKDKIAKKIISVLPEGECFCDLFGGGGAMTDCALQSGKYKKAIYNEIEPLIYKAFKKAVHGDFKNESRWISRDDFFKLKDTDPYAAICFSFGNNLKTYCYSPEIERFKKHLHYMFFADTPKEARLHWKAFVREFASAIKGLDELQSLESLERLQSLQSLESLERLQRLERLERLQSLQRLEIYNLSYEQVEIPHGSVIYCDIPYAGTSKYKSNFDYEKFYKWALNQDNLVFVSEYSMPEGFNVVAEWEKTCSLSSTNNTKTVEKLFCNKPYKI